MDIRVFFRTVRRSVYSSDFNRNIMVFLACLAMAGIAWLMMTLNDSYEQEISVVVRYVNVPRNAVLTSNESDTLRVNVRDKGFSLLSYLAGRERETVDIDFPHYAHANGMGVVSAADLSRKVAALLPASMKVTSVKPEKWTFYYNYGERKKVPVKWRGTVAPEKSFFIAQTHIEPDSVVVYASPQKLDSIHEVYTEQLDYVDVRDTLRVKARLRRQDGVKLLPGEVSLTFCPDVLTEGSISDIPVVGINMPEGKVLRTFPGKVSVKFVTGMKNYQALSKYGFLVVADYDQLKDNKQSQCQLKLTRVPSGVWRARLEVEEVDYLIEDKTP